MALRFSYKFFSLLRSRGAGLTSPYAEPLVSRWSKIELEVALVFAPTTTELFRLFAAFRLAT